jgi:hypothetical protein
MADVSESQSADWDSKIRSSNEGLVDYPSCERTNCLNWKEGRCALKNPEKSGNSCLDYEDAMDFVRLKADAIRGTLG